MRYDNSTSNYFLIRDKQLPKRLGTYLGRATVSTALILIQVPTPPKAKMNAYLYNRNTILG